MHALGHRTFTRSDLHCSLPIATSVPRTSTPSASIIDRRTNATLSVPNLSRSNRPPTYDMAPTLPSSPRRRSSRLAAMGSTSKSRVTKPLTPSKPSSRATTSSQHRQPKAANAHHGRDMTTTQLNEPPQTPTAPFSDTTTMPNASTPQTGYDSLPLELRQQTLANTIHDAYIDAWFAPPTPGLPYSLPSAANNKFWNVIRDLEDSFGFAEPPRGTFCFVNLIQGLKELNQEISDEVEMLIIQRDSRHHLLTADEVKFLSDPFWGNMSLGAREERMRADRWPLRSMVDLAFLQSVQRKLNKILRKWDRDCRAGMI